MGVFAGTVARLPDKLGDAGGREVQESPPLADVILSRPRNAQRVAPFVPRHVGQRRLVGRGVETRELAVARIDQDQSQLVQPNTQGAVEIRLRRPGKPSDNQRTRSDRRRAPKRAIDDRPPIGSDRLQELPVGPR